MVLAIETATEVCSVAVKDEGGTIREERTEEYGGHSERLFEYIKKLKREQGISMHELEACLISEGPGSYTGLRIGASGVKGLLFGSDIPLYAINTLAGIAAGVYGQIPTRVTVHAVIDARRHHLYHQAFTFAEEGMVPKNKADIRRLTELNDYIDTIDIVAGTGWERLDEALLDSVRTYGVEKISARSLITLFEQLVEKKEGEDELKSEHQQPIRRVRPDQFDPNYITSKKPGT